MASALRTVEDVAQYLAGQNLTHAKKVFTDHNIDWSIFNKETVELLKNLIGRTNEEFQNDLSHLTLPPCPESYIEEKSKVFQDPVHGPIALPGICVDIIDTPQFQRLRDIKQLGSTHFVYPSAVHSRFEHSIGVCFLAGELVQGLRNSCSAITPKDVLCIQIAGLCHDLGHGPYSKLYEAKYMDCFRDSSEIPDEDKWKHAMVSVRILDHMFSDHSNQLVSRFRKTGLGWKDYLFIREQIYSSEPLQGRVEQTFLYKVMSTARGDIDICKWDYLARDCHHLGLANSFDYKRFIRFARVINRNINGNELCIGLRDKEAYNVLKMYDMLHFLHRNVYQHRVVASIDITHVEAMMEAPQVFQVFQNDTSSRTMSENEVDLDKFLKLTDSTFSHIQTSENQDLVPAKTILDSKQLRTRYQCIESKTFTGNKFRSKRDARDKLLSRVSDETMRRKLKKLCIDLRSKKSSDRIQRSELEQREYENSYFFVQLVFLNFGDPARDMCYYSKSNQDVCIENQDTISDMIPMRNFKEQLVRVFHRSTMDEDIRTTLKEAMRNLHERFRDEDDI